jgi:hypothetical protein
MSVFDLWQLEQDRRNNLPERTMADVLALPEDLRTNRERTPLLAPWYICSRIMKEKDERHSPYCRVHIQRSNRQALTGERV